MKTRHLVVGLLLTAKAFAMLQPRIVSTVHRTGDRVLALIQVATPADPAADAAPAIQAAIDEVRAAGGGTVFLPVGRYRLATALIIREAVTLRGDWAGHARPADGTLLAVDHGAGSEAGPAAITIERGAGLREVAVWYPQQSTAQPVPYPWCLRASEQVHGDNYTVKNVTLVNPWRGFCVGPEWNELHTLHNVAGTPLRTGVFIDTTTDIGRLTEVDFAPRWWVDSKLPGAPTAAALAPLLRQATGVDMGRSDWEYFDQVRVTGYGTGVHLHQGQQGTTNAVMFACELTGGTVGLRVEALNGVGLAVTGGRLGGSEAGLLTTDRFTTVVQLNSVTFEPGGPAARLHGAGTATFQHCTLGGAVLADRGTLSVLDRQGPADGAPLVCGPQMQRIRLLDAGPADVRAATAADCLVAQPRRTWQRPQVSPGERAPEVRSRGAGLQVVTAHGASPEAADNTAAFQAALDAAAAGGDTVYVPAGRWKLAGTLRVPTGVELRGCFDVPHHTVSDGTVLLTTAGKGAEDGPPLITLGAGAGVRGLTVWYPEQDLRAPVPYPWAVRSSGPRCWAVDLTVGNCWQGLDFGSQPSDGHVIRYFAGGLLRRGLWVSRSDGPGWVEDTQLNPHYCLRLPPSLPHPPFEGDLGGALIRYQRAHLDGLVFGRCAEERLRGNFLYAAYDGLAFRDDGGAMHGRVVNHGSDTVSRSCCVEATDPRGIELLNSQLVPLSDQAVAAFVTTPSFRGRVAFHNSQVWAGRTTARLDGPGEVLLSQFNSLTGPLLLHAGTAQVIGGVLQRDRGDDLTVAAGVAADAVALLADDGVSVGGPGAAATRALLNAASPPPAELHGQPADYQLTTSFEPGQPVAAPDTVSRGGGQRATSAVTCRPVDGAGRAAGRALRLAGRSDDPAYSFAYFAAVDGPLPLLADSVLRYWIKAENAQGRYTCVDLVCTDGATLRDSGANLTGGGSARGAGSHGPVGEWTAIEVPLGVLAGKTVAQLMLAYDTRSGGGDFAVLLDDLSISSELASVPNYRLPAALATARHGQPVDLALPAGWAARWTLDGHNPTLTSRAAAQVTLPAGQVELRVGLVSPAGTLLPTVWAWASEVP
ncbi:MAG: hypothetical protein IT204_25555 [Fimbriimonadaceae bacterium]|nr:hypothetical protein [Fimbriimonadaceae bacterium]